MQTIKQGMKGPQVMRWQFFLAGIGYTYIKADGDFGQKSHRATVDFQQKNGLDADGVVGEKTYLAAFHAGYNLQEARDYPDKPEFQPLTGNSARAKIFGSFKYKAANDGTDAVIITDDWAKKNIKFVEIPQLKGIPGVPPSGRIQFHQLAEKQLVNLFADWEKAGLKDRILTFGGSFVPRFVRGRPGVLSNHAFGSAFDINVPQNGLGRMPALVGDKGSVRELVKIANKNGFYWGGHFSRLDGMHFEVAVVKK
jgi:peptidoglycan hydrolase-like protein with peptidoglycan-binding domain